MLPRLPWCSSAAEHFGRVSRPRLPRITADATDEDAGGGRGLLALVWLRL